MICQTHLHSMHLTPSQQAAWASCFVLEFMRQVRVSSPGWKSRQSQIQQAEGNRCVEGFCVLLLMMGQVCSKKLISSIVTASLGLIYSGTSYWERLWKQTSWMISRLADLCCDISCHNTLQKKNHFVTFISLTQHRNCVSKGMKEASPSSENPDRVKIQDSFASRVHDLGII